MGPMGMGIWSRDGDLDPGPAVYKTAALPLSYLGKSVNLRDPEVLTQILANLDSYFWDKTSFITELSRQY